MKGLLVFGAFAALFFGVVVAEWLVTDDRKGFWLGPSGILAEILFCFLRPF